MLEGHGFKSCRKLEKSQTYLKMDAKLRYQKQNRVKRAQNGYIPHVECQLTKFHFSFLGCTGPDGNFYFGGQTWSMPDCGRGVCAKTLRGGWEITVERFVQSSKRSINSSFSMKQDFCVQFSRTTLASNHDVALIKVIIKKAKLYTLPVSPTLVSWHTQ